ncbi:flagellar motor switch protein FliN [Allochromatium vinosum]|uniref:Flagellar motor switch protein FliN n=1 Tax=Allochromatium vinosum (strain ATCC 17899 / DSM 180 / NBRC 103801 / NCIMB 10441 / D) TaxID=572477 RepID=D3RRC5_ALLVD|nr:flagellar motor switch protein FliN [Allochromatium vinosum]ADC63837.1 flagellar motor switch protein FliN [Allochromatium vinosum DSM 180]
MSNDNDTNPAEIDPDEAIADAWAAALEEQKENKPAGETHSGMEGVRRMNPEDFSGFKPEPTSDVNLNMVLDVPVTISMEIGRTRIPIRNLLQLNQGSVVELDRLAGEPLDVLVNGTLIAHGEVVVVNEKFGIRLTDVISPSERVRKLR